VGIVVALGRGIRRIRQQWWQRCGAAAGKACYTAAGRARVETETVQITALGAAGNTLRHSRRGKRRGAPMSSAVNASMQFSAVYNTTCAQLTNRGLKAAECISPSAGGTCFEGLCGGGGGGTFCNATT
jgi:hypothetical protein